MEVESLEMNSLRTVWLLVSLRKSFVSACRTLQTMDLQILHARPNSGYWENPGGIQAP